MDNAIQVVDDSSIIFLSLISVELIWNTCRSIFIYISVRYYFTIIKEVRQIRTIRLSDFTDSAARDYEQEFHEEMMNEYPGHGHRENVMWYCMNTTSFIITIFLDIMAATSVYIKSYNLLVIWLCLYILFSFFEATATIQMMRIYANKLYFKRKWRHCLCTFAGCTTFRFYLIWLCQDLPFISNK